MIILLATGMSRLELESDIAAFLPKALLPMNTLSTLVSDLGKIHDDELLILCDSQTYKYLEWWAAATAFPIDRIIPTGLVSTSHWSLYFLDNLDLILTRYFASSKSNEKSRRLTIISAEQVFGSHIASLLNCENSRIYSKKSDAADRTNSNDDGPIAFMTLSHKDALWWKDHVSDISASIATTLPKSQFEAFVEQCKSSLNIETLSADSIMDPLLLEWLSPNLSLERYHSHLATSSLFAPFQTPSPTPVPPIETRVYARIGLIGNPSDGFYGRTISCLIKNYWATCRLLPNPDPLDPRIEFMPGYVSDSIHLSSFSAGREWTNRNGYNGTLRLFLATLSVLSTYTKSKGIPLSTRGFKVCTGTNIPRQVGLAGSSALVVSFLKSMISFYGLDIPPHVQANLALSAEVDELGIAAGHQDRVIQCYGGCVYMDFEEGLMKGRGWGDYSTIPTSLLPRIWIAYVKNPKESGKVHNDVKMRFLNGDEKVRESMRTFASLATRCRDLLVQGTPEGIAPLMAANFECRRELYGEAVIGAQTCSIIEIAGRFGCAAKLSGSGGCVIGMPLTPNSVTDNCRALKTALEKEGYVFCWLDFE